MATATRTQRRYDHRLRNLVRTMRDSRPVHDPRRSNSRPLRLVPFRSWSRPTIIAMCRPGRWLGSLKGSARSSLRRVPGIGWCGSMRGDVLGNGSTRPRRRSGFALSVRMKSGTWTPRSSACSYPLMNRHQAVICIRRRARRWRRCSRAARDSCCRACRTFSGWAAAQRSGRSSRRAGSSAGRIAGRRRRTSVR